jgi:hypothetical protein
LLKRGVDRDRLWVTQVARNLVMDIEDAECRVKYLIRDRDGKYPALFDAVLADAGITVTQKSVSSGRIIGIRHRSASRSVQASRSQHARGLPVVISPKPTTTLVRGGSAGTLLPPVSSPVDQR